jgi:hypothetical protein
VEVSCVKKFKIFGYPKIHSGAIISIGMVVSELGSKFLKGQVSSPEYRLDLALSLHFWSFGFS